MRVLWPVTVRAEEDITVKRRRHTPEQIVRKLREVDRLVGEGQTVAEAAKQVEISEQTYHRWRNQYGGMKADDARRLRELERENARLKRLVADKELELDALREIAKGNWSLCVKQEPCAERVHPRGADGRRRRRAGVSDSGGPRGDSCPRAVCAGRRRSRRSSTSALA